MLINTFTHLKRRIAYIVAKVLQCLGAMTVENKKACSDFMFTFRHSHVVVDCSKGPGWIGVLYY